MTCSWCGGFHGVRRVESHSTVVVRCNSQSPFDPRARCRRSKGHAGECRADAPTSDLYLCSRCWGVWRESGERPQAFRMREPEAGPITGRPLDPRLLR